MLVHKNVGMKQLELIYNSLSYMNNVHVYTYGETRILGTSLPSSAVMALLATLAMHCMARVA